MTLPQGWVRTTIGDTSEAIQYGLTCTSSRSGGSYRYIRITDIQNRKIDWDAVPFADVPYGQAAPYRVENGDILFARTGATVGKSYLVRNLEFDAAFASYLIRVKCDDKFMSPEFAACYFQSPSYWDQILDGSEGTGQPNFNGSKLAKLVIDLPPLSEQHRIVAKLGALAAYLSRAREELDRVPVLAERLRISVLRGAFGRQGANASPGWELKRVDEIGEVQLGRQRSPKDHHGPNMRPYVRSANITWNGWDLSDVKEMNFSPAEFKTFSLKEGDVLLNEGSGSAKEVGKPAIWRGEVADACFQNTLLRVRPTEYSPELLRYAFLYLALSGQFIANTKGVNIIHIGKAGLARTLLPVPPRDDQQAILEKFDAAFARADRLEAEATRARALLDRLEAAILAKAFSGELVPQDPNDEPASVLLDRIRAERAAAPKPRRGRARKAVG